MRIRISELRSAVNKTSQKLENKNQALVRLATRLEYFINDKSVANDASINKIKRNMSDFYLPQIKSMRQQNSLLIQKNNKLLSSYNSIVKVSVDINDAKLEHFQTQLNSLRQQKTVIINALNDPRNSASKTSGVISTNRINDINSKIAALEENIENIKNMRLFNAQNVALYDEILNSYKKINASLRNRKAIKFKEVIIEEDDPTGKGGGGAGAGAAGVIGATAATTQKTSSKTVDKQVTNDNQMTPNLNNDNTEGGNDVITPIPDQDPITPEVYTEYTVSPGDTFESLAQKYYSDPTLADELATYNNMEVDTVLPIGLVIKIPAELIPIIDDITDGGGFTPPTEGGEVVTPPNDEPVINNPDLENDIKFGNEIRFE